MPAIKGCIYISTHFLTSQPALFKLDNENIGGHLTPLQSATLGLHPVTIATNFPSHSGQEAELAWANGRLATCSRLLAEDRVRVKPATSLLQVRYSTTTPLHPRLVWYVLYADYCMPAVTWNPTQVVHLPVASWWLRTCRVNDTYWTTVFLNILLVLLVRAHYKLLVLIPHLLSCFLKKICAYVDSFTSIVLLLSDVDVHSFIKLIYSYHLS